MSTFTKYKKIEKPISIERYSVDVVNKNSDIIDSELHKLELKNESQDDSLATKEELSSEVSRAITKENAIENSLTSEISRAQSAEYQISRDLDGEINRATTAESNISAALSNHISNHSNPHHVTKEQIDLCNVDNTSDMDKPVSTAQQNALDSAVSTHNTSESSHSDMRLLISELTTRLNALADSDDTTLDQLSEIVAYVKNNKNLIDGITTNKINVSDIIDNLTTTSVDKPLSANQGKVLKELITNITPIIDTKVDKVSGKGLSTNDYTDEEKAKLANISSGAMSATNIADSNNGEPINIRLSGEWGYNKYAVGYLGSGYNIIPCMSLRVAGDPSPTITPAQKYHNAALEIREVGVRGAMTGDDSEAPRIGFHWGNRVAGTMALLSNGNFALIKGNGISKAYIECSAQYAEFDNIHGFTIGNELAKLYNGYTMNKPAQIAREGQSSNWITGRNAAIIKQTTCNSCYCPTISMKTDTGSWELGPYTENNLWLSYCSDNNYNAGINDPQVQYKFEPGGTFIANNFVDNRYGYNVCDEIYNLKNSVSDGKKSVATAITAKGVTTAADASFATMATNIGMISTGVRMIGVARGNQSVYFNNPANITVNFTIPDSYWQGRSRAYVLVSIWLIGSKYQVSSVNLSGDIVDSFPKSARVEFAVASSATGSYSLAKKNSYSVTLTTPSEGSATYNHYGNVCMTIEYGVV